MTTETTDRIEDIAGLLVTKPNAQAGSDTGGDGSQADGIHDAGNNTDVSGSDDDALLAIDAEHGEVTDAEPTEQGGSDDAISDEPRYTVTVDGKPVQVTLKEALAGYQRTEDYTRKTQEVAESRKAIDAETAQVRAHREQYAALLKTAQERLGPAEKEPTVEEWNRLRMDDPTMYAVEWAAYQQRQEARATLKAEQDRIAGEQSHEDLKKFKGYVDGEKEKLFAAFPAWKEEKKYIEGAKAIFEWAKTSLGFSDKELAHVYDHRIMVMADKARRFDALVSAREKAKQKLAAAPEMPEPGARTPQRKPSDMKRAAAMKRLNETGKAEDAAALLTLG